MAHHHNLQLHTEPHHNPLQLHMEPHRNPVLHMEHRNPLLHMEQHNLLLHTALHTALPLLAPSHRRTNPKPPHLVAILLHPTALPLLGPSHRRTKPPHLVAILLHPTAAAPFAALLPSTFPPGTDPSIIACFQVADQDGSGIIDDKELQRALSSYNQSFSLRTVHLLMYLFTNTNTRKIGPKEFSPLFYSLQNWRANFERFDRDRSGKIDINELREALMSLGFAVSPVVLDLLVSKFDKTGGKNKAIEYDNFIECCLTVKGLTDKFKERDTAYSGSASFDYENFMLTVLPFLVA
ncbi:CALCIUM-BINDING PROTEIN CML48-RELATED [Salix koriyanagi]|uniref:CALCIUM-BINDING PROTEIN CML48-RELATED n=1 Tax=Salix koriyanagi TaxID=2511006 RepID=A0A9Q0ZUL3_9ROSI|nr:CALCIUM-BINDING PROTEIN CML48-RELATED [Salix koriyanagi]